MNPIAWTPEGRAVNAKTMISKNESGDVLTPSPLS